MRKSPGKKPPGGAVKNNTPKPGEGLPRLSNQEELEFLHAMEDYKQKHNRPFPTWSEVLGVLRELGYVKPGRSDKKQRGRDWAARVSVLLQERDQLKLELAEVRKQRAEATLALGHLVFGPVPEIDKEALFREAATQPTLSELVAEIEAELLGMAKNAGA
jgi:hypothetical protein